MKYSFLFLFLLTSLISIKAQTNELSVLAEPLCNDSASSADFFAFDTDTMEVDTKEYMIEVPLEIDYTLNDMLHSWMIEFTDSTDCFHDSIAPTFPDSIYIQRLQHLPYIMEMPYNKNVRAFIDLYTVNRRQYLGSLIGKAAYYNPIFEERLNAYGLPLELKNLPIIESALNPHAVSHAGAGGLWQFMIATGRMYGLEINSLVDERCDPIKSSDAACRFLRDLYNIYGDWHLVIAAYNCGPGNVNKAIRRASGKRCYWDIFPYLPRETRGYVPIFIGACYAVNYADEHKICPTKTNMPLLTDTIITTKRIHLEQIATVLEMPLAELKMLNPQYRKDIVPGGKAYSICLPLSKAVEFVDKENDILSYRADELINNRKAEIDIAQKTASDGSYTQGNTVYYKVKSGDTLGGIAYRYKVSVSQLQKWNKLSGTTIRIGQTLKIQK